MKRLLTEQQEQAFRLIHHDHQGLSQTEAAAIMGIDQATVSRLLAKVEEVMPDFFPILSKREIVYYHYLTVDGWTVNEIASYECVTPNAVYLTFQRCKAKGLSFPGPHGKVLRYKPEMDSRVINKF